MHMNILEVVLENVLKIYRPKIYFCTTPNKDFNIHFEMNDSEMRHPDHKFEFTKNEFETFCRSLALKYNYSIEFYGVGSLDVVNTRGYCSQIAIFWRNSSLIPSGENNYEEVFEERFKVEYPYETEETRLDREYQRLCFDIKTSLDSIALNKYYNLDEGIEAVCDFTFFNLKYNTFSVILLF